MASMVATCSSPNSLQLRLAMNCSSSSNRRCSPATGIQVAQARARKLWVPCGASLPFSIAPRRCAVASASDNFAGWTNSDDSPQSSAKSQPHTENWLPLPGGFLVAGVAGFTLLAALTYAAFSLGNRTSSQPAQQMEPLAAHHQVSLVSYSADDHAPLHTTEESNYINLEIQTGSHASHLSEAPAENLLDQSDDPSTLDAMTYTASSNEGRNNPSVEEVFQYESTFKDEPVAPEAASSSLNLPDSTTIISLPQNLPESTSEIEPSPGNAEAANLLHTTDTNAAHKREFPGSDVETEYNPLLESSSSAVDEPMDTIVEPQTFPKEDMKAGTLLSPNENPDLTEAPQASTGRIKSSPEAMSSDEIVFSGMKPVSASAFPFANEPIVVDDNEIHQVGPSFESTSAYNTFQSAGIPAPSVVSAALQELPGKVLVPAAVDQVHGQALTALQVLKVIESDVQPTGLCTRREYARWLVAASSALSRSMVSKVYPAMYIEGATELAFDDISPSDPDFSSIQGLAEAGLIASKLSGRDLPASSNGDLGPFNFSPESPLSRQDLVSWKMALEKRQLPEADEKILYQLSGFRDIDKINPDAWPALVADLSAGDQGIIPLAFGCIRLFQPDKPVTKAQAAVALATGEASDIVSEELERIEAESMAETAVSAHNALVAEVEQDINASFEKELLCERERVDAVEKLAEEARQELERLRSEREEDSITLMKERASIESEMEVLSMLRHDLEEQLQGLMSNKVEISYEKERIIKLQKQAENEKQEISRLHYELEVERKALSLARSWAEDEAKRARELAKALEKARDRWEREGIKVVVDSDLREESSTAVTWLTAAKQVSVEGTVSRAENLLNKLKLMAVSVTGKSRQVISKIIQRINLLVSNLKEWAKEFQNTAVLKMRGSVEQLQQNTADLSTGIKEKTIESMQELRQSSAGFSFALKEGAKRVAGDCRDGVEKLAHKFKS